MANYPNKPWSNNQTAEIYPGVNFKYNAESGVWTQHAEVQTSADSDAFEARYNSDKGHLAARISALESNPTGGLDSEQVLNIVSNLSFDFETF